MFFTIQSQPHNGFKDLKVVFRVCVFNPTFLIGAKTLHLMCVYQKGMLISSEIIEIYIAIKNPVSNYSSVTVAHFILYFFNTTCNGSVSSSSSPFCTGLFWHHKKYTSLSGAISYICLKKKKKMYPSFKSENVAFLNSASFIVKSGRWNSLPCVPHDAASWLATAAKLLMWRHIFPGSISPLVNVKLRRNDWEKN